MLDFVTCWRCGVEFDLTPFRIGAPCADCQLDFPDEDWSSPWLAHTGKHTSPDDLKRRQDDVRKLHALGLPDNRIAEAVNGKTASVSRVRKQLGLPGIVSRGPALWREESLESVRKKALERWQDTDFRASVLPKIRKGTREKRIKMRGERSGATRKAFLHCRNGHLYTDESTFISQDGVRHCRICWRLAKKRQKLNKEAEEA